MAESERAPRLPDYVTPQYPRLVEGLVQSGAEEGGDGEADGEGGGAVLPGEGRGAGGADFHLDALGAALADQQVELPADGRNDRLVHLVAADPDGLADDDAGQRDDRHLGRAAADIDDHVARGLGDRQAGADRCGHRLFDQIDLARSCGERRVADCSLFDLGDARGNADDDARLDEGAPVVGPHDEVAEHRLGDLEVGDHPVLHGAHSDDVTRRPAEHLFGLSSDGQHLLAAGCAALHRHN